LADVLVAMNPAALLANMKWVKKGACIIIDIDNFDNKSYKKAGYIEDPLNDGSLEGYLVIKAPISHLTHSTLQESGFGLKTVDKTKNQFVAGMLYWLFNRDIKIGEKFIESRFKQDPDIVEANKMVLRAGYNYAETIEAMTTTFQVNPATDKKGLFRNITGNIAITWGLLAAAEKSGRKLFLGSYPITPASEIIQEMATRKHLGALTFQAEDEIAGIISAIGAAYAGCLAVTSTSGPGLSLKGEAIGLAVITEVPLVIINVQRGGPARRSRCESVWAYHQPSGKLSPALPSFQPRMPERTGNTYPPKRSTWRGFSRQLQPPDHPARENVFQSSEDPSSVINRLIIILI